ncbi:zinc-dependent metalloprotease [Parasediminibacterium sp. JCM 36343]|uniref:zinc-dependent metalloprotease n=1 Tax=Parasediminibacterium sp. JCM 36343 TaxID=3374279 RepID=UPI00397E6198
MRKLFVTTALLITFSAFAQKKIPLPDTAKTKPMPTRAELNAFLGVKSSSDGPKPYKDVITDKAISKIGLFVVHKVEDKYYFEIPDTLLGREILSVVRFVKVPSGAGYGGEIANQNTLSFEKGPNNMLFIRTITLVNTADSSQVIYKAVTNSNVNSIAAAFPIAAKGKDSLHPSSIIDVTEFFKGDNMLVSIGANAKRKFSFGGLSPDRSYTQTINTYPINTEIKTVKTFSSFGGGGFGLPSSPSASLTAATGSGAVTLELNTSLLLLPKTPMARRPADKRVGYFTEDFTQYNDTQQQVENKEFAIRWRLEPKEGEWQKWMKGELVEPQKPLVYYIDPATPKQWRPYLIAGINDWQKAFEKAGFKNAIIGKEWPENDTTMSLEDARFSVLRYFASDVENAYGPNVHDPRSGEIIESHIGWYHNVMKLVHDWYMIQTAAVDPRARKMKFDESLMGDLIRFVSSHEVGHTLGLRHNMGSSSRTPVEKLRNKAWVEANGHTASIMDYARFNYVAQPEDSIGKMGLYPRIGDYDLWAIKWGYSFIPGSTDEELKKASNKMIISALKENPRTWFGTYEGGNTSDPRTQSEDLGDNAIKASEYGIKNLQRILPNLPQWTKEEAGLNENLSDIYGQLVTQFRRYIGHVTRNVGGVYETFKSVEEQGAVYEITPKAMQKDAVAFLNKQVFATPKWLIEKDIWDKINNPVGGDPIASLQENALSNLISNERMVRMQACAERFGADKAYNAIELFTDVQSGLFTELTSHKPIELYRRLLQKSYVDKLAAIVNPAPSSAPTFSFPGFSFSIGTDASRSDLPAIARGQLQQLRSQIIASIPLTTDKMSRLHLQDLQERIKRALEPK